MEKEKWYLKSVEEVQNGLKTDLKKGLQKEEVTNRYQQYGYNRLETGKKKSGFQMFIEQFKDFMIIVLIIAAAVSGLIGVMENEGPWDAVIIIGIVIINAVIGTVQEIKAQKSLDALKKMSSHVAKVIRNGELLVIPSEELVPGDLIEIETGDFVPADIRLIEAVNLKIQEAALTGESVAVEKQIETIEDEEAGIGDRVNMMFSSSLVTYGRGKGIVVETGMKTEVGKIAGILQEAEDTETPLQQKLNKLGKTLGLVVLAICIIIFAVGFIRNPEEMLEVFMTAVSLAVAAIPEGLPAISTIVLAIGVQKMVKKNAIVKTLPSVETLGSSTVICSDKTGTLTQNKMTVEKIYYNEKEFDMNRQIESGIDNDDLKILINSAVLCNDTKVSNEDKLTGDPTETALVDMGLKLGLNKNELGTPRVQEIPFDSDRKLMTTVHKVDDKYIVYTKGAVDELLKRCTKIQLNGQVAELSEKHTKDIGENNYNMAKEALRVLAMAYKILDHEPTKDEMLNLESNLIYIGQVGMIDPARPECKDAVAKCKTAGIKVVMITGDHRITAIAIAKQLGILEDENEAITGADVEKMTDEELIAKVRSVSVYARVSPEHKVRIVKAWQANGEVVAMTGDGVNDAPAVKTADIGVAMGIVGTDVSKEAADVVLTDDNFATIVASVEEGRRIYDNILKTIQFLLSSNIGEIIVLFIATMIGWDAPLLPIHLLWINLVTDSLPAIALAFDPAEKDIMKRKPKKANTIFTKGVTWRIVYQGSMVGILTLVAYWIGNKTHGVEVGQTMAFIVLAMSELVHVFNIRSNNGSAFRTMFNNKILLGAVTISALIMGIVISIPALAPIFSVVTLKELPLDNLLETIGLVFAPLLIVEGFKLLRINSSKEEKVTK